MLLLSTTRCRGHLSQVNTPVLRINGHPPSAGFRDIFVAKYEASGDLVWAKRAGGTSTDEGHGIAVDGAGNSYVTGDFRDSATFGPGETNATTLTSAGGDDIFVAKYEASGDLVWAKRAGGTSTDEGHGIAVDGAGNSYVTGDFRDSATFGPGETNATTLTSASAGSADIFVAKYSGAPLPPPVNVLQDCWTTNLTLDPDPELELYTFTTADSIDFIWKQKLQETCSAYLASIWVFQCLPGKPLPGPIVQVFHDIDFGQQDPVPGTPEPLLSFSAPPGSIPPGRYDWALVTECDDTNGRIAGAPVPDSDIDDSCGVNVGVLPVFPGPVMLGPEPVELFDADPGGSPPGRGPGEEGTTRPWCFDVTGVM